MIYVSFHWFRQKQRLFLGKSHGPHFYKVDLNEVLDSRVKPWRWNLITKTVAFIHSGMESRQRHTNSVPSGFAGFATARRIVVFRLLLRCHRDISATPQHLTILRKYRLKTAGAGGNAQHQVIPAAAPCHAPLCGLRGDRLDQISTGLQCLPLQGLLSVPTLKEFPCHESCDCAVRHARSNALQRQG
ncbi:uncharacterized protein LOC129829186 isoform X2 [Salvelinus fontinalis]|uniref:uncharacterized protein LOC129829186 isoform X2 n=1 Tax=Salvelinus fontinalis TaxID=8038 RepID=UPI0024857FF0|nr:uncharacterized protein LOC129829186 isoform X2 [Salvelinus fontinalis]